MFNQIRTRNPELFKDIPANLWYNAKFGQTVIVAHARFVELTTHNWKDTAEAWSSKEFYEFIAVNNSGEFMFFSDIAEDSELKDARIVPGVAGSLAEFSKFCEEFTVKDDRRLGMPPEIWFEKRCGFCLGVLNNESDMNYVISFAGDTVHNSAKQYGRD